MDTQTASMAPQHRAKPRTKPAVRTGEQSAQALTRRPQEAAGYVVCSPRVRPRDKAQADANKARATRYLCIVGLLLIVLLASQAD